MDEDGYFYVCYYVLFIVIGFFFVFNFVFGVLSGWVFNLFDYCLVNILVMSN